MLYRTIDFLFAARGDYVIMGDLSNIQKIIRNPAFGLLPIILFSFIIGRMDTRIAVSIALLLSILGFFAVKRYSRLIYDISIITFAISLFLSFVIFPELDEFRIFVIVEVVFVLSLIITRLARSRIVHRLAKNENPREKNYLSESFRVAFQAQYGLSVHLLLILSYFVFSTSSTSETPFIDWLAILCVAQITLVMLILMEIIRLRILDKKLYDEEWLPVITEKGDVTGRVAKSITKDLKNKFMHPVVRVALIYKGRLYLKERDSSRLLNPGKLDYPFEKYMQFNHDIDETVHNSIRKQSGNEDIPLRFLLKYIFENEHTKRLIFLYVSVIDDERTFNNLRLTGGKLWTETQIEDNMGSDIFSECFELEYEYLKNTVLLAHQYR